MPMKKRFAVGSEITKTANCAPLPKKRKTRYFSSMQPMNLARPTWKKLWTCLQDILKQ
jgi:hypothetical protein